MRPNGQAFPGSPLTRARQRRCCAVQRLTCCLRRTSWRQPYFWLLVRLMPPPGPWSADSSPSLPPPSWPASRCICGNATKVAWLSVPDPLVDSPRTWCPDRCATASWTPYPGRRAAASWTTTSLASTCSLFSRSAAGLNVADSGPVLALLLRAAEGFAGGTGVGAAVAVRAADMLFAAPVDLAPAEGNAGNVRLPRFLAPAQIKRSSLICCACEHGNPAQRAARANGRGP